MPCQTRGTVTEASEGVGTPRAGVRGSAGRRLGLLLSKHGVLDALGETELADPLRGNLERLTGLRIPPHPGLAVREHELPEARQDEAVLGFLARDGECLVEHLDDLLLRQAGLLREVGH